MAQKKKASVSSGVSKSAQSVSKTVPARSKPASAKKVAAKKTAPAKTAKTTTTQQSVTKSTAKSTPVKTATPKSATKKPTAKAAAQKTTAKKTTTAAKAPVKPAASAGKGRGGAAATKSKFAAAAKAVAARRAAATPPAAERPAKSVAAAATVAKKSSAPVSAKQEAQAEPARKSASPKHNFKQDEYVVYPAHGVGQIVAIEEQEIAGMSLELFVITFEKDKMTLRVPTAKVDAMRKLADGAVIEKAMQTLKGRARVKRTMWSRRAQEYENKINSGDLISIAEVVRDLYRSENQPEQSYSERQLYEAALDRMARELAAVENIDERGAVQRITDVLSKSAKGRRQAEEEKAEAEAEAEAGSDAEGEGSAEAA